MKDLWSKIAAALGLCVAVCAAAPAEAHIIITSHQTRLGKDQIKRGPCGGGDTARGDAVYTLLSGATIQIEFDEFIFHPGYFRVAFDDDGQDDFVDPADYFDFNTNDTVLMDNILPDHTRGDGPIFTIEVTLPDVECDNCTLQLAQIMTDKPPYTVGGNDLYYNCIDLVLTRDDALLNGAPEPEAPPAGPGTLDDGGCSMVSGAGQSGALGFWALLGLGVWAARRRRAQ